MYLQHWACRQRPEHNRFLEVYGCFLAGTVGQASSYSRRVPVIPVGSDVRSSEALLSPRKRRIVDWREAQPSAVLPADFQGSAHQVTHHPPPADAAQLQERCLCETLKGSGTTREIPVSSVH